MTPEEILLAARLAAATLLALAPKEEAHRILDEESVKLTNRMADTAEQIKFPHG